MKRWEMWKASASAVLIAAIASPGFAQLHEERARGLVEGGVVRLDSAVPRPNTKAVGVSSPTVLLSGYGQIAVAQGSFFMDGATAAIPYYGYAGDGPMVPAPGDVQSSTHKVEATKTEPDKNTYLVLANQDGPSGVDYGTHFVFQGHENGSKDASGNTQGYITRINLDADGAHRVTLMATADTSGKPLPAIDGSTWDPWAQRLLFTYEGGTSGGVWQATLNYPSTVEDLGGIVGRGSYEGIQNDSDGNLWIVEDAGGPAGTTNTHAKQPNSFVYRFTPSDKTDLKKGGKLQALQVSSLSIGGPIVFHAGQADADILSTDVKDLHTYGKRFSTTWVTLHDTATDGTTPFDANALAKSKSATPFKRPENGVFRPGSGFGQFFFTETGDTNLQTEAGSAYGGHGSIMKLSQSGPSSATGTLTVFFVGDSIHSGLDNIAFWDADHLVAIEDAGDTLHAQRNMLDSAYIFDVTGDYSDPLGFPPVRLLAEGRDAAATLDSQYLAAGAGFQNDGDNELTGFHVSDGDPGTTGILGAKAPTPFQNAWRVFYTQQHGDNVTWEIVRTKAATTPDFTLF